jgi:hypothetical protein
VIKDNSNNEYLDSQVSPVNALSTNRNYVPYELVFKAVLPPLGYSVFSIKHLSSVTNPKFKHSTLSVPGQSNNYPNILPNFFIGNNQLKLEFDGQSGLIINVQTLDPTTGAVTNKIDLTQNFYIYRSKERGYSSSKPSGAYRFSPIDNEVKGNSQNSFKFFFSQNEKKFNLLLNSLSLSLRLQYQQIKQVIKYFVVRKRMKYIKCSLIG